MPDPGAHHTQTHHSGQIRAATIAHHTEYGNTRNLWETHVSQRRTRFWRHVHRERDPQHYKDRPIKCRYLMEKACTSHAFYGSTIEAFIVGITNRLLVLLAFRTKVLCTRRSYVHATESRAGIPVGGNSIADGKGETRSTVGTVGATEAGGGGRSRAGSSGDTPS